MAKKKAKTSSTGASAPKRVYRLLVALAAGPVTEEFQKDNPKVVRVIIIRGNQSLAKLHDAIFDAMDRVDEHMYEFQVGGREPLDPRALRYVLPEMRSGPFSSRDSNLGGGVSRTKIDALDLAVGDAFFYWFDYGDEWWHVIEVKAIYEEGAQAGNAGTDADEMKGALKGRHPRVIERIGESPPQYPDWEDEDEEDD
ncbi:MAG: IS1096 element passenger TnpR family protein [Planctomycetota bacterium]